jgi:hypothetical protein
VPIVVDSLGQPLGPLVSQNGHVLVSVGYDRFFATVSTGGFARGGMIYYSTPNCSGTSYTVGTFTPNSVAHAAVLDASTAWVIDAPQGTVFSPTTAPLHVSRQVIDPATGLVGPCTPLFWGATLVLWPVKPVSINHFAPPFGIQ